MYDIVIIGAGPAGANLARLIGNQYKVLLMDKRDFENESAQKLRINAAEACWHPTRRK
jgi:geranylgeranyl reductase